MTSSRHGSVSTCNQSDHEHVKTGDADRWLALACWRWNNSRDDEAAAVRVLWPTVRDDLACTSLAATLVDVARNAKVQAKLALKVERRADETTLDK